MEKKWWHKSVVYQVYPRSFKDTNGDGIGDLRGIIEKIDHIKELGANVIWLSPVYKSPMDDNGYDISDYYDIAPEFGSMDDMDELIEEGLKRGIKIVMDLVVNHTSDEHPWFIESKSSLDNPKRDWYIWKDKPNNWESFFTPSAWEYDDKTNQYYLHLFSKKQPDLNWANKEVRSAVYDMMHFWLKKGIGGFRMDVINMIGKPSDYPDASIFDEGVAGWEHWANNALGHQYLREMHEEVLSKYDVLTVGETPFTTTMDGKLYSHPDRKELNMIFQFEHMGIDREEHNAKRKAFDLVEFKRIMSKWQDDLYEKGWNSVYWSNHDQARTVSRFGNDQKYHEKSAKMLGAVLHMMSGTPYVYQGEEIGTTNTHFESIDEINDIMGKFHYQKMMEKGITNDDAMAYLNVFSRDHARVPVSWNDSEFAGFSNVAPWLKTNPRYKDINVEESKKNKDSVFYFYQKLIDLRMNSVYSDTIVYGKHEMVNIDDTSVYSYIREYKNQSILVIGNFTDEAVIRSFKFDSSRVILTNSKKTDVDLNKFTLNPYDVYIIEIKK